MKRIKLIDFLKSSGLDAIRSLSKAGYQAVYAITDLAGNDWITKDILLDAIVTFGIPNPFVYNIPANSQTPIIINFEDSTIKYGAGSPVFMSVDLLSYQQNPDIKFKQIIDSENTKPIGNEGWIANEEWTDNTYTSLVNLTLQPDTDTGLPGGLTIDNINIIIKP